MPTIRISDDTANRLKKLARPLDDTWDTFLGRVGGFLAEREQEFLAFDPQENHGDQPPGSVGAGQSLEDRHVARMTATGRGLYEKVRLLARNFGEDVEIGAVASYLRFSVKGGNFAEITPRTNGLVMYIRPEGLDLERGASGTYHGVAVDRPANANWSLDVRIRVTATTDLDGVAALLRQSYNTVKHLRGA